MPCLFQQTLHPKELKIMQNRLVTHEETMFQIPRQKDGKTKESLQLRLQLKRRNRLAEDGDPGALKGSLAVITRADQGSLCHLLF